MTALGLERSGIQRVDTDASLPDWISPEFVADADVDCGRVEDVEIVASCSGTIDEALYAVRERLLTLRRSIRFGFLDRVTRFVTDDPAL